MLDVVIQVLFVISAVAVMQWVVICAGIVLGNRTKIPVPIPYVSFTYGNTYLWSYAIAFQVYFWANYYGIFQYM